MKFIAEGVLMVLSSVVLLLLTGCLNDPEDADDVKPQIIAEPQSIAAMFEDTVFFKVSIAHDPVAEFQWFCSDTMIPYAKDSVLMFAPVSYSDTGDYYVFVSNRVGYVVSQKVHLSVSGGEPVIAQLPAVYSLNLKDSITLIAKVAGLSPFYFQWYREGQPISGAVGRTFSIPSFSNADSGTYNVVVKNPIGIDTSTQTRLYPAGTLYITETDFISGSKVEQMSIKTSRITATGTALYKDIAVRSYEGYIYLIERYGADNIIKYDPSKVGDNAFIYQKKLIDNCNPQDIEFVNDRKAYVANNNEPEITEFDPSTGAFLNHIDISDYTFRPDSNTSPYAADLQLVAPYLYVLLQRRHGWNPGAPSLILKINTFTDSIMDTIALNFKNGNAMTYANGALYVTNPGSPFSSNDGGIEMVDLATKKVTILFEESALGGSPNSIVYKENNRFYITIYTESQKSSVLEIDVATKKVVATLEGVKDAFGGIYYDVVSRKLFVGERDNVEMGVKIFENNVQVGTTVRTASSLAPSGFAVVR